ncbi:FkbM family methyltransferase [Thermodesulfobacteriota bacterium]
MSSKIPANSVIFDVGANFGYFAKGLSSLDGRSCTLYCFEPISYNFRILKAAVASRENITIENLALSNTIGNLKFKIPVKNNRICSSLPHLGDEKSKDYISEDVNSTTIDDYISSHNISQLNLIKCDTEGSELLVFQGAFHSIKRFDPDIFCEINETYTLRCGYPASEIFAFFNDLGYQVFQTDFKTNRLGEVSAYSSPGDYFFRKEPKDSFTGLAGFSANPRDPPE